MDKEKIIRDLLETYKDRDELHISYKKKMKEIISQAIEEILVCASDSDTGDELDVQKWVDNFVEERFKPIDN